MSQVRDDEGRRGPVTFRLPDDLRDAADRLAAERAKDHPGYSRSDVLRVALIEHLRRAERERLAECST